MTSTSDIPALVRRLRSPRRLEQVQAAEALARLLAGSDVAAAVQALVAAGGCAALARMVVSGSSQAAQRAAARALNAADDTSAPTTDSLATDFTKQAAGEASGSIPAMLALLQSSDTELQEAAAYLVYCVAFVNPERRPAMVNAGGLTALLGCLRQHAGPCTQPQQENSLVYCCIALAFLCESTPEVQRAVAAAGGAAVLVPLLASGSPLVQLGAAECVRWLASDCPEGQQAAVAAGAIPALTQLLASSAAPNESACAAAIHALLALRPQWLADVQQVVGSIPGLLRVLQQSSEGVDRQAALGSLGSLYLSGGLPELRAMAAAGAVPVLQRYLTGHGQDGSVPWHVKVASALLDALNGLPDR